MRGSSRWLLLCVAVTGGACAHPALVPAPAAVVRVSPACDSLAQAIRSGVAHPAVHQPSARELFVPPPGAPADLRESELTVSWQVAASGQAVLDSASVPRSSNAGYRRRLLRALSQYVFNPAMADGCPVPGVFTMRLVLQ